MSSLLASFVKEQKDVSYDDVSKWFFEDERDGLSEVHVLIKEGGEIYHLDPMEDEHVEFLKNFCMFLKELGYEMIHPKYGPIEEFPESFQSLLMVPKILP